MRDYSRSDSVCSNLTVSRGLPMKWAVSMTSRLVSMEGQSFSWPAAEGETRNPMAVHTAAQIWTPKEDRRLLELIEAGNLCVFVSGEPQSTCEIIRIPQPKLLKAKGNDERHRARCDCFCSAASLAARRVIAFIGVFASIRRLLSRLGSSNLATSSRWGHQITVSAHFQEGDLESRLNKPEYDTALAIMSGNERRPSPSRRSL